MAERPTVVGHVTTTIEKIGRPPLRLRVGLSDTPTGTIGAMPITKGPGVETAYGASSVAGASALVV
jgi:hypothetical protein